MSHIVEFKSLGYDTPTKIIFEPDYTYQNGINIKYSIEIRECDIVTISKKIKELLQFLGWNTSDVKFLVKSSLWPSVNTRSLVAVKTIRELFAENDINLKASPI